MDAMQQMQLEMQANMMQMMMKVCADKTIGKNHSGADLSSSEKTQFKNCIIKMIDAPKYIMPAMMDGAQGGGPQF